MKRPLPSYTYVGKSFDAARGEPRYRLKNQKGEDVYVSSFKLLQLERAGRIIRNEETDNV